MKSIFNLIAAITLFAVPAITIIAPSACSAGENDLAFGQTHSDHNSEVHELLDEAEQLFRERKFTIPDGNNSYDKLLMVLSYDSDNARAKEGIKAILDWYLNQMHKAQKKGDWRKVNEYSKRALSIDRNLDMARKMFRMAQDKLYPKHGHNQGSFGGASSTQYNHMGD